MRPTAPPPIRRHGFSCDETRDLLPGYALGALDPAERVLVGRHCAACPPCNSELQGFATSVALLPLSAPLVAPPPAVKSALFARIAAEPIAAASLPTLQSLPTNLVVDSPAAKRRRGRHTASPTPATPIDMPPTRTPSTIRNLQFAAPFVVLLLIVGGYAFSLNSSLDTAEQEIALLRAVPVDGAVAAAADIAGSADAALAAADGLVVAQPLIALDTASDAALTDTTSIVGPSESRCQMLGYSDGVFILQISNMRVPVTDRSAGVFVVDQFGVESLVHTFSVSADGSVETSFQFDGAITDIVAVHVVPLGDDAPRGAKTGRRTGFYFSLIHIPAAERQLTQTAIGS